MARLAEREKAERARIRKQADDQRRREKAERTAAARVAREEADATRAAELAALREAQYIPSEVASIFRTDVRTIRRWIEDGLIEALKLPGGHWRIAKSEIERIQREGFNRPKPAKKEAAA